MATILRKRRKKRQSVKYLNSTSWLKNSSFCYRPAMICYLSWSICALMQFSNANNSWHENVNFKIKLNSFKNQQRQQKNQY